MLRKGGAAVDGPGTVHPRHSIAPSAFCQLRAEVAWQGHRRGWPQANSPISFSLGLSLNENFCTLGFKPETRFHQSSLPHCVTQASFIFSVKHEKSASAGSD